MVTLHTRRRPQIQLQLGDAFHPAWILSLGDERLLIDAGVELAAGTEVVVHLPRPDGHSDDLVATRALHCHQDVLAPASAEYRFLIVLDLEHIGATARAALAAAAAEPVARSAWTWRRRPPTHDAELVQHTFALGAAE